MADGGRFCQSCGRQQPGAAITAHGAPAVAAAPSAVQSPGEKNGMAALLSFLLPGLGQIIKGEILKAILIWVGIAVFTVLSFFVIGIPFLVVLWFWQIYDAYNAPQRS